MLSSSNRSFHKVHRTLAAILALLTIAQPVIAASLWTPGSEWNQVFRDDKAQVVGDLVTVLVVENSSASERASTTADRSNNLDAGLSAFINPSIDDKIFGGQGTSVDYPKIGFGGSSEYEGQGTFTRSGSISATVGAIVKQVLPNGNLLIEGKRNFLVNKEKRNIILTGIIRPRDINGNNQILSTSIADLQVTYEGKGPVSDKAKPGLFSTIFDLIPIF